MNRSKPLGRALQYLALLGYIAFLAFPLIWMLSTSFKTPQEIVELHPSLIPRNPTLDNYSSAFEQQHLARAAWNSLQVSVGAAVLTVLIALPAAYALARVRSRINTLATAWILLSQLFPFILLVIPLFIILKEAQLTNSLFGLILVYVTWSLPFALWMLQGFVRSIPRELEEAASMDGASRFQTLWRIVAPLLAPGVVAVTLFAFISSWNEFFFALVLLKRPELATLPLELAKFVGIEGIARLGPLAAGSLMATVPSLVFFAFLQRRLTSGGLAGAVKG